MQEVDPRDAIGVARQSRFSLLNQFRKVSGSKGMSNGVSSSGRKIWANETNFRPRSSQEEVNAYLVSK